MGVRDQYFIWEAIFKKSCLISSVCGINNNVFLERYISFWILFIMKQRIVNMETTITTMKTEYKVMKDAFLLSKY